MLDCMIFIGGHTFISEWRWLCASKRTPASPLGFLERGIYESSTGPLLTAERETTSSKRQVSVKQWSTVKTMFEGKRHLTKRHLTWKITDNDMWFPENPVEKCWVKVTVDTYWEWRQKWQRQRISINTNGLKGGGSGLAFHSVMKSYRAERPV